MAADGLPNRPFPLLLPCWVSATATWHVVSMWRSGIVNHERAFPTTSRQSVYGSLYFWPCDRIPLVSTCTMLHICSCTQLVGRGVAPHSHNYCHCFGPHCKGACSGGSVLDAICEVTDEATARRTHAQRVRSPPVQKHSVPATTSLRPTTCPEQRLWPAVFGSC